MTHPVDVHVGKQLKKLRIMRGKTQTEVAEGLGISFQQVQKYELGRNRISASRLFDISKILGVETSYFFEGLEDVNVTAESGSSVDQEAHSLAATYSKIQDQKVRCQIRNFITEIARDL